VPTLGKLDFACRLGQLFFEASNDEIGFAEDEMVGGRKLVLASSPKLLCPFRLRFRDGSA
jgi:hypothetical protein